MITPATTHALRERAAKTPSQPVCTTGSWSVTSNTAPATSAKPPAGKGEPLNPVLQFVFIAALAILITWAGFAWFINAVHYPHYLEQKALHDQ